MVTFTFGHPPTNRLIRIQQSDPFTIIFRFFLTPDKIYPNSGQKWQISQETKKYSYPRQSQKQMATLYRYIVYIPVHVEQFDEGATAES
jgi:hypothetical protein